MNIDETAITGAIYTRCCGINISNPHDSVPAIRFDQESVLETEGGTVTLKGVESITAAFKPDEEFPLLDGGTMTHQALYENLYAAWLHYKNLPPVEQPESI